MFEIDARAPQGKSNENADGLPCDSPNERLPRRLPDGYLFVSSAAYLAVLVFLSSGASLPAATLDSGKILACRVAFFGGSICSLMLLKLLGPLLESRARATAFATVCTLFALLSCIPVANPMLATTLWFVGGAGVNLLMVPWIVVNASDDGLSVGAMSTRIAASFGIAALLFALFSMLLPDAIAPATAVLVIIAGAMLIWGQRAAGDKDDSPKSQECDLAEGSESQGEFKILWNSLVVVFCFSVCIGLGTSVVRYSTSTMLADVMQGGAMCLSAFVLAFDQMHKPPLFTERRQLSLFLTFASVGILCMIVGDTTIRMLGGLLLILYFTLSAVSCLVTMIMLVKVFQLPVSRVLSLGSCIPMGLLVGTLLSDGIAALGYDSLIGGGLLAATLLVLVILASFVFLEHSPMQDMTREIVEELAVRKEHKENGSWRKRLLAGLAEQYHLTPREREIIQLLMRGWSAEGISEQLVISVTTVKTHVAHIYEKLDVHSRDELLTFVNQFGNQLVE